ncbi:hypothetical protein GCM10023321_54450 [Pseudonocardia eucalypti]|uniref:DUF3887 domain-containing protein n=1 Tax=Pseudonocardia eucalypti TaxID=648755 RepID=A0ABP9QNR4_9PSEU|nr:hypothetical protein [Pseudonocardia eucalypti]
MRITNGRNHLVGTVTLAVGLALAGNLALGVAGGTPQARATETVATAPTQARYDQRALEQLNNIARGNYGAVHAALDPDLQRKISPNTIADAWSKLQQSHGNYLFPGRPSTSPRGELSVVEVPLHMARQPGRFQITFHPNGRIAGLYLLPN